MEKTINIDCYASFKIMKTGKILKFCSQIYGQILFNTDGFTDKFAYQFSGENLSKLEKQHLRSQDVFEFELAFTSGASANLIPTYS